LIYIISYLCEIESFLAIHYLTHYSSTQYKQNQDPRTFKFSGSSCLPAYPGFMVMKNPQHGMRVTIWGSPGNWN
jgi:hypothetical protein